jgi:hypothetical protein
MMKAYMKCYTPIRNAPRAFRQATSNPKEDQAQTLCVSLSLGVRFLCHHLLVRHTGLCSLAFPDWPDLVIRAMTANTWLSL